MTSTSSVDKMVPVVGALNPELHEPSAPRLQDCTVQQEMPGSQQSVVRNETIPTLLSPAQSRKNCHAALHALGTPDKEAAVELTTFLDLPAEVQTEILRMTTQGEHTLPPLALVNKQMFGLIASLPEFPPQQKRMKNACKNAISETLVATIRAHLPAVRLCAEPIMLPSSLPVATLKELAALLKRSVQRPLIVDSNAGILRVELGSCADQFHLFRSSEEYLHYKENLICQRDSAVRDLIKFMKDMKDRELLRHLRC